MPDPVRSETHARTAAALAALPDDALAGAVASATPIGTGIGGVVATLDVGGVPVFVKSVPLTDLERAHPHSTANLFDLPTCCQYGVSSPGFGAWRELATHQMTTDWVLSGACPSFPVLYHWRVLPRAASPALTPAEERDVERQFLAWDRCEPIRRRFAARYLATRSIVLFLEHFPHNLRAAPGPAERVERELLAVTSFMNEHGLVHFDAHFENILTDGDHLYVSDFGQALSSAFTLAPAERDFLASHRDFDTGYVLTALASAYGVERYARIAALVKTFFANLRLTKSAPYPAAALAAELQRAGLR